jgi:hypothetical protein
MIETWLRAEAVAEAHPEEFVQAGPAGQDGRSRTY